MQDAAKRGQSMINDLLELSRVTTQAKPFQRTDLNQVLREVLSDLELRLEKTGAVVEVGDLPVIDADPTQMRQLFLNLLSNALKFSKPDSQPVIRLSSTANTSEIVEISVSDNGIGFDDEYTKRIFKPFQRLHGRGEYEGSGIGLSICRKIVERHGGSITAKSESGAGSTFIVTLPAAMSQDRQMERK
jgi:signal transduction histidine kinase